MLRAVLRVLTAVLQSAASYIEMIQLTDKAAERLIKVLEAGETIRIAVQGGGCSGMSYCLNIETEEPDEEDILLDIPAVKIYIDPMSAGILKDTTVDYVATLQQEGFVFNNPAANTTCGCGSSFS